MALADRLRTSRPLLERAVYLLAVIGILVCVHLFIQQSRGFDRGCFGFSGPQPVAASCEAVTQSSAGQLLGVSNAIWGGLFYLAVAALTVAFAYAKETLRGSLKVARSVLVGGGLLYSGYLTQYQLTRFAEPCKLCLISAAIVLVLALIHAYDLLKPLSSDRTSMRRTPAFFASLAVLLVVLVGADLAYFNSLPATAAAPAVVEEGAAEDAAVRPVDAEATASAAQCMYDPSKPAVENYADFVNFTDATKGTAGTGVTVIEFFDPNCPHCKTLAPIMQEVVEANSDRAQFVYKAFPLWEFSVPQVLALNVAAEEGKFFEMMEAQFARQQRGGLNLETLRQVATEIGMDPEAMIERMREQDLQQELLSMRRDAMEAGVSGMPTVWINGQFVHHSSRNVECLTELIAEAANSDS